MGLWVLVFVFVEVYFVFMYFDFGLFWGRERGFVVVVNLVLGWGVE